MWAKFEGIVGLFISNSFYILNINPLFKFNHIKKITNFVKSFAKQLTGEILYAIISAYESRSSLLTCRILF